MQKIQPHFWQRSISGASLSGPGSHDYTIYQKLNVCVSYTEIFLKSRQLKLDARDWAAVSFGGAVGRELEVEGQALVIFPVLVRDF